MKSVWLQLFSSRTILNLDWISVCIRAIGFMATLFLTMKMNN